MALALESLVDAARSGARRAARRTRDRHPVGWEVDPGAARVNEVSVTYS